MTPPGADRASLSNRLRRLVRATAAILAAFVFAAPSTVLAQRAAAPADVGVANGMNDNSATMRELVADLQQMHLTVCASRVQQAMSFLFDGQEARFVAEPLGPDSDRWPAVFVIESAPPPGGGRTRFSTLMIAPNCAGMYEQVIYWPQPCDGVHASIFPKFTGDRVLYRDVKVEANGPALTVYLTPAGTGCVSIKKELFR